jgi:lysophospholipase
MPPGVARGTVVLSGGRTEPIEKYFEVIGELQARSFAVLIHDWRGQGLSHRELPDRMKGHAGGYDTFVADFKALLDAYADRAPKPWIALGHSMGGCLTLLALAKGAAHQFAGAVLSAPMLGLHLPMPLRTANFLSRLFNTLGQGTAYCPGGPTPLDDPFKGNRLTHDEARFMRHHNQILAHPELNIGGPTWGWIAFALAATAYLAKPENLARIDIPVVICSAAADKIVVNEAQEAAAQALPDARLVPIPGAFHEIMMETDDKRALFWEAFDRLAARAAPPRTAPIRLDAPPGRKRAARRATPPSP